MNTKLITIKTIKTEKEGALSFFEGQRDIPFRIQRIYYIHDVNKGTQRGGHAHLDLEQMLFCPFGQIEIVVDNGKEKRSYMLDSPDKGLYIGSGIWRDMIWHQDNSVLCVAASNYYMENDYIRNYADFSRLVKEGYWNEKDEDRI